MDRRHKLIRDYEASDASVHDSRKLDDLIDADNTASDVWGDSAYRSADAENRLEDKGYRSHIHHKGKRNKPLTARQIKANKTRSKVRVRVEHVFGFQQRSMGGKFIRTIGMAPGEGEDRHDEPGLQHEPSHTARKRRGGPRLICFKGCSARKNQINALKTANIRAMISLSKAGGR